VFATVNGRQHQANSYPQDGAVTLVSRDPDNPDPALFQRNQELGAWVAVVPVGSCERLAEVTSLADHLGHTCQVISIDRDGLVGLYYLGEEKAAVLRDGFVQVDAGTWAKTVNVHEIYGYRERHTDLRFDDWKATAGPS
jgi:hypothetical protein